MARHYSNNRGPRNDGPRINNQIQGGDIRLIDADGEMVGVVTVEKALAMAEDSGLDLVEISPNTDPPVCKILDYGKYRYEQQKKAAAARKNQKVVEVKEVKLRPNIDEHDYQVKMRSVKRFLEEGNKVKITIRFRGREMTHQELGRNLLQRIREETQDQSKVEFEPKMEGRQMIMILAPE